MVDGAVNATQWTTTMAQPHPFAIVQFAKQNADAYFLFAAEIAEANDIQELLAIQHRYMTTQMQAITSQAQEIARVIAVAAQRM